MANAMTRKQRNALKTIPGVVKLSAREVEVFIEGCDEGRADEEKTDALAYEVAEMLGWGDLSWSGFNSVTIRPGGSVDMGDWNDKASRWHY